MEDDVLESTMNKTQRMSLRLSDSAVEAIETISKLYGGGLKASEVVRRAIGTELLLAEAAANGETILIEKPDGRQVELRMVR